MLSIKKSNNKRTTNEQQMDKSWSLPLSGTEMIPPIVHEPMCKIEDFGETDYVKKA
jgi:hypothetical protein